MPLPEALQRRQTIESRHHDIEQHHVRRFVLLHRSQQLVSACVAPRFVAAQSQEGTEIGGKSRVVIYNSDVGFVHLFLYVLQTVRC
jgi:hypothetical protein